MDGIAFGLAILMASSAGAPAVEMPRVAPSAFTYDLPDPATPALRDQFRASPRASFAPVQDTTTKRLSPIFRAVVVCAGAGLGFIAG